MGKKSQPQAPAPPDPYAVGQAQTGTNIQTAIANAYMGNANEIGPQGSITYEPTSWHGINGPTGVSGTGGPMSHGAGGAGFGPESLGIAGMNPGAMGAILGSGGGGQGQGSGGFQVPQFTRRVTLSPEQQRLYDLNTQTQEGLGKIGLEQTKRIGGVLSSPIDASGLPQTPGDFSADRTRIEGDLFSRLNPQLERDRTSLETNLVNQGFQRGTEAFNNAMDQYGRQSNDARLAVTAQGGDEQSRMFNMANANRSERLKEMLALRNQPINEITALLSGSQVSLPSGPNYNAPTVGNTPIGDYMYNSAALQQQNYQQQMQQRNAMMGGIMGLGQAGILGAAKMAPMFMSDRRLKEDIRDLGIKLVNGLTLYAYKYLWSPFERVGVMADEVALVRPNAVHRVGDYIAVDYGSL